MGIAADIVGPIGMADNIEGVALELDWIWIGVIFLVGSLCQGATGFGFGLVSMGLLSIFMNVTDSLLINTSLTMALSFIILIKYWRFIDIKPVIYTLLPAALVGRGFAFYVLHTYGGTEWMKKGLGVFLIGMVVFLAWQRSREKLSGRKLDFSRPAIGASAGVTAGFIGGVFGVGGPFLVMYFLARYADRERYTANLQVVFILLSLVTMSAHGIGGDFTASSVWYIAIGIPIISLGTYMGMLMFRSMPMHRLHQFIYSLIVFAGINVLFS